jgi:ABC-type nickel/cobalt efflux system permease component RcnA
MAEKTMAPVSYGAIALVGVWLGWRGVRRWWASRPMDHHEHHEGCGCGHAHGPDPEAAAKVGNWREAAVLIASIAIRPCTGAIVVLLLCWKLGIDLAGIAGAFVMGLGTASVTLLVAFAAHGLRSSALMQVAGGKGALRLQAIIEIAAGAIVCIAASQLLLRAL